MSASHVTFHITETLKRWQPTLALLGRWIGYGTWHGARFLLLLIIVVAPWAFGAVDAWVEELLGLLLVAAFCLWLLGLVLRRYSALVLPIAFLPFVLFISWGLLQLIPLERTWLSLLTPASVSVREQLVGPLESAATVSLYAAATRYNLARSLLVLSMFFLGSQLFYRRQHQQVLCAVATLNGLLLAYFGLWQHVTGTDLIYWTFRPTDGATFFGPFANRNNAGCYLNLSLATGLALFLNASHWRFAKSSWSVMAGESLVQRLFSYPAEVLRGFAGLGQKKLALLGLIALVASGIVLSASRTSLLALIGSCLASCWVARLQSRSKSSLVGWGTALALIVVWLFASEFLDEAARSKLNSLKDPQQLLQDGRLEHWPKAIAAACSYGLTGSGLGTYRYVYRLFETGPATVWFQHAENQYLETLVESGVIGFSILLVGVLLVLRCGYRLGLQPHDSWSRALALAVAFMIAGQAVHALFDFGLSLTANAMLFALLLGCVAGRDANLSRTQSKHGQRKESVGASAAIVSDAWTLWRYLANISGGVMMTLASAIAVSEIANRADMDAALRWPLAEQQKAPSARSELHAPSLLNLEPKSRDLVRLQLAYALRECPDDAEGHLALALALIDEYRIAALAELVTETHGQLNRQALQPLATLSTLRQQAQRLLDSHALTERDELLRSPPVTTWLGPALTHLQVARELCPLNPEVHWQLAQLGFLSPSEPASAEHLRRAAQLASGSAAFWYRQGQVALELNCPSDVLSAWQRSLELSLQYQPEILAVAVTLFSPEQVLSMLPDDSWNLLRLHANWGNAAEHAPLRERLMQRVDVQLASLEPATAEQWYELSRFNYERGRPLEATEQLRHAVQHAPDNTSFRYKYAVKLWDAGRVAEARTQAAICVAQEPSHRAADELLQRILATQTPRGAVRSARY